MNKKNDKRRGARYVYFYKCSVAGHTGLAATVRHGCGIYAAGGKIACQKTWGRFLEHVKDGVKLSGEYDKNSVAIENLSFLHEAGGT